MEWEPITRGKIKVLDRQSNPVVILAEAPLSASPDSEWQQAFSNPAGVEAPSTMRQPKLNGNAVAIEVSRADELPRVVAYVDGAIRWANQYYESTVVPRLRREAGDRGREGQVRQAEIEKAREIAEDL